MVSEKPTKKLHRGFARRSGGILLALTTAALAVLFFPRIAQAQFILCAAAPGSLNGPYITVNSDQDPVNGINVRSGPNSYLYDKVGKLYPGESAPAIGRTAGGDWIEVACPGAPGGTGWVYSPNVTLTSSGFLQIVEPPPTPAISFTLDPTLIAAFSVQPTATRLPTFTPPAPLTQAVYTDAPRPVSSPWTAPLIAGLGIAGLFGLVISFLFRR